MKPYIPGILAISLLSACSHSNESRSIKMDQSYQHTFTSVGYAPIDAQSGDSFDLKMLNAIKASKLEAYKEMAEQVYGVLVTAGDNTEGGLLIGDKIESKVKGLVRGARVLRSYHEGDVYITELELDIKTLPFLQAPELNLHGTSVIKIEEAVYY